MKIFQRGEKGFTLIEMLIVVGIIGVLAAVATTQVPKLIGSADTAAKSAEIDVVQSSVDALMADNQLSSLVATNLVTTTATNDMTAFPWSTGSPYKLSDYMRDSTTKYTYTVSATGLVAQP